MCVGWYLSGKEIDCSQQSSTSSAPTTQSVPLHIFVYDIE